MLKHIRRLAPRSATLSVAVVAALGSMAAVAQEVEGEESQQAATLERITVTGSRIPRTGFVTPAPVTSLTAEDISTTGAVTIGDLLNQLPALGTTFSLPNSSRFIGTVGLGMLDLRRMGTNRTLVLVNGRRHVGSSAGSSAVDVNTIPVEWIERVEILTGGASSIYGADAVTGVVNFILKRSMDGFEVRGQTGVSDEGGFNRSFGSFSAGSDFAGGRGNFAFSLEASTQDSMEFSDRRIGRTQYALILSDPADPTSTRLLAPNAGSYTFFDGGGFIVGGQRYVFDPDGSFRERNLGSFRDGAACQDCDYLDTASVAQLQPGFDRVSFNTIANFDLSDRHSLYFEGKYARTDSDFLSQPAFASPFPYRIARDNAYLTPELAAFMDDNGLSSIDVARFDVDAGRRGEDVTRETSRFVLGVEGLIGETWQYDISANHGRMAERRTNLNNRINDRWSASIDAVFDDDGNIVCRATRDGMFINQQRPTRPDGSVPLEAVPDFARAGCVPTSIFGAGAVNAEARDFFNASSESSTILSQTVLSAGLSQPELFELPAGLVGFATGVEYRRERSQQNTDALSAAGLTFLNAIPSRGGEYDVREAYAEVNVPLLSGLPAVDQLDFTAAGRMADYSTIGSAFSWSAGLDWKAHEDLRVRSSYATAIRAPNIAELFNPQTENFANFRDPCSVDIIPSAPDADRRRANCAALGLPADFFAPPSSSFRGRSGGNPDLREEEAKTFTFGFVYTPGWLDGFGLTADFWDIELTDAIGSTSAALTASRCVDSPSGIDNEFCRRIQRDPDTGQIVFWEATSQNLQKLTARGVDLELAYSWEAFNGRFDARLLGTYLMERRFFAFQEDPDEFVENRGTLGDPRRQAMLNLGYAAGPYSMSWKMRFIDDMLRVSNESFAANPDSQHPIKTGSVTYSDLQLRYRFGGSLELYLGIDNVFDKDPPVGLFGNGEGSALYDNIGRYSYLGFNYRF